MGRGLIRIIPAAFLSLLISISSNAKDTGLSWQPAGYGGGGRFTAVAIDPSDPQTVYVGSDVAGIYKSRDGGNRFTLMGRGLEGFAVADIAINPASPHQVVALTDDGLYYSLNQGKEWLRIKGKARYPSRFFGSRLLLFTQSSLWIGTDTNGVFQLPLNDFGALPLKPVPGLEHVKVNGLTVYAGYLYAGTSRGVYRLEEQIWKPQNHGLSSGYEEITDIAASGHVLYLVEKQKGLFRWNADKLLWEGRPVALQPRTKDYKSLLVHPRNPDLVFLGSHPENWPQRLYRTQDGGTTWKSILSFQGDREAPPNWTNTLSGVEEMAFVPGSARSLFLTDWWNLWQSSDDGDHWHQRHYGLQNTCINDLKIHPQNRQKMYLCAWDNGLMISEDSGKHWRRAMNGVARDGHGQEIELSPRDPSRMVLLINLRGQKGKMYVYESLNGGASWKDIGFTVPSEPLAKHSYVDGMATNLELDPFSHDTIYVGTNGYGVYKTTNGGKTWVPMNQGLHTPFISGPGALRVHPQTPGTLFASTLAGGIYRSTDGASSWQRVTTGDRFTFGMAIAPSRPSRILAGAAGNSLLLSDNGGQSWQEIHLPVRAAPEMAVYSVAFSPGKPDLILAGTTRYDVRATEGIFVSTDSAKTFRQVPMELPRVNATVITPMADESAAYVGFNGTGIFRLEFGEKS
jgi:photosystem II stability/assembly factor-like uncharacterized protein